MRKLLLIAVLAATTAAGLDAKHRYGKWRGKDCYDSPRHVVIYESYRDPYYGYLPPGLERQLWRRGHLPPGLEKQLWRRGRLPPGLAKRYNPAYPGYGGSRGGVVFGWKW